MQPTCGEGVEVRAVDGAEVDGAGEATDNEVEAVPTAERVAAVKAAVPTPAAATTTAELAGE